MLVYVIYAVLQITEIGLGEWLGSVVKPPVYLRSGPTIQPGDLSIVGEKKSSSGLGH